MADLKTKDDLPEEILIALEELDKLSLDPNMRMEALNKEMWIRDQISLIRMAENAEKNGYDSGFKKGYTKGSDVGRQEESKAIAKNLKDLGIDKNIIKASTGLDIETIDKLQCKAIKKMKELGADIDFIQATTGLDPETIKNL